MSRAWQEPVPDERLGEARPGALLTSAAAVPLGVAVLVAAGMLPWGARLVLGVALAVLGLRVGALARTATGARIRPATARALGAATVVAGVVLVAVAVGVALDGGGLESPSLTDGTDAPLGLFAAGQGPSGPFTLLEPVLDGWAAVVTGLLLAVAGAGLAGGAGLGRRSAAPHGDAVAPGDGTVPAPHPVPVAVAVALSGIGGAVAALALTGDGALGLGADVRAPVLALAALVGAAVVAVRPGDVLARGAGVAAGIVVALCLGEVTGLVSQALAGGVGPPVLAPGSTAVSALVVVLAQAAAAVLLGVALRRRDVVLGTLPAGVLLLVRPSEDGLLQAAVLVVPVVLAVLAAGALRDVGATRRLVPGSAAPAVAAAAAVVLLVGAAGALAPPDSVYVPLGDPLDRGVDAGRLVVGLLSVLVLGVLVVVALRATPGTVAAGAPAATAVVGLYVLRPLGLVASAAPDSVLTGTALSVLLPAVEVAVGVVLARRHATPVVLAALGLLAVAGLQSAGIGVASAGTDVDGELVVALTLGPATLLVVAAATVALLGPPRRVLRAQALAAGATAGALLAGGSATASLGFAVEGDAAGLQDGAALLGVALVALGALGVALLAASTARRASPAIATAVAVATAFLAMVVASVAAAVADPAGPGEDIRSVAAPLARAALGFDASGGLLGRVAPGWPLLLGILGGVLLATAAWLESRRPAPPDAPAG